MPARVHLTIAVFVWLLCPNPTTGLPVRFNPSPEALQGFFLALRAARREGKLLVGAAVTVGGGKTFTSVGFAFGLAAKPLPVVRFATPLASAVLLTSFLRARFTLSHRAPHRVPCLWNSQAYTSGPYRPMTGRLSVGIVSCLDGAPY